MKTRNIISPKYWAVMLAVPMLFTSCKDEDPVDNSANTNGVSLNSNTTDVCQYANRLEFPHLSSNGTSQVLVNKTNDKYDADGINYCVEWDSNLKSQRWSCYQMHTGYSVSGISRFTPDDDSDRQYPYDPRLTMGGTYLDDDYFYGSGFDHGHMCPSADRLYSSYANWQTFYMTNMQPQLNSFNAGIWEKLESQIRSWAGIYTCENMYVVKGGTIDSEENIYKYVTKSNGKDRLIVPKYYFVALLAKNAYGYKAIGFWFDQTAGIKSNDKLANYALSIDELERKTGIDFFCNLPDDIEEARESRCDLTAWGL